GAGWWRKGNVGEEGIPRFGEGDRCASIGGRVCKHYKERDIGVALFLAFCTFVACAVPVAFSLPMMVRKEFEEGRMRTRVLWIRGTVREQINLMEAGLQLSLNSFTLMQMIESCALLDKELADQARTLLYKQKSAAIRHKTRQHWIQTQVQEQCSRLEAGMPLTMTIGNLKELTQACVEIDPDLAAANVMEAPDAPALEQGRLALRVPAATGDKETSPSRTPNPSSKELESTQVKKAPEGATGDDAEEIQLPKLKMYPHPLHSPIPEPPHRNDQQGEDDVVPFDDGESMLGDPPPVVGSHFFGTPDGRDAQNPKKARRDQEKRQDDGQLKKDEDAGQGRKKDKEERKEKHRDKDKDKEERKEKHKDKEHKKDKHKDKDKDKGEKKEKRKDKEQGEEKSKHKSKDR
ncbi:hypothetical protein CYMTET_17869, partial [Cymbomonas tetramitiformis]